MRTLFFTLCALSCFLALPASAAQLQLTSSGAPTLGDAILVTVSLNTEGESVNALEGRLSYPQGSLSLEEIRSGSSLINFWAEAPADEDGSIRFAGITPGGYIGNGGELFSLLFKVTAEDDLRFSLSEARTLKNDGEASMLPFTLAPTVIQSDTPAQLELTKLHDTIAPHPFTAHRARDTALFDGEWFVSFATQDKESGVDHYEVAERRGFPLPRFLQALLTFEVATSPYALKDARAYVYVKAVDKAGNTRLSILPPEKGSYGGDFGIVLVVLLLLASLIYVFRRIKRG